MKKRILIYSVILIALICFNTEKTNAQWLSNGTSIVYTTDKVGIGTVTPAANFDIIGPSTGNSYISFPTLKVSSGQSSGRVAMWLETISNNPTDLVFRNNGAGRVWLSSRNSSEEYQFRIYTNPEVADYPGRMAMAINQNGRIGIGTTSPTQLLDVNGNIRASDFYFSSGLSLYSQLSNLQSQIFSNNSDISYLMSCCNNNFKSASISDENILPAKLFQNIPNPFDVETEIKYYIPEESNIASIMIHNIQGVLVKIVEIENKGESSVFIQGSELKKGIYAYSLSIDGKVKDTKIMVLTK